MEVNSIIGTSAVAGTTAQAARVANDMGAAEFMQLLMAQLTHQDPLEPMNNAEMMSQFSQLNSLQELRDIRTALVDVSTAYQTTYLTSLIGKTVSASRIGGAPIEGVVDGVVLGETPQLTIGEDMVDMADVITIRGEAV
jgi:flagellar basal-body rod modification protein FlgD